jgi:hypothetical protein
VNEPAYTDLANYYLHHVEPDHVPHWDSDALADDEVLDTSAASIAACGLLQTSAGSRAPTSAPTGTARPS